MYYFASVSLRLLCECRNILFFSIASGTENMSQMSWVERERDL